MDTEKARSAFTYSTVMNSLRILNSFTVDEPEKRVNDLSIELGIEKSSVSRLLSTLASEGYVKKDPETQRYRLGLRILTLNSIVTSQLEINREARPILKNLVKDTGEAAHIAVLEEREVVYIEQIECSHPVRILSYVGRRNPVHCTGSGKLLLSYRDPDEIDSLLEGELASHTPLTITNKNDLKEQLKEIRSQEFCMSDSEFLQDVIVFAAPIRDYTGRVIASVSLVGPKHRIPKHLYPTYKIKVIKAGKEISRNMGFM